MQSITLLPGVWTRHAAGRRAIWGDLTKLVTVVNQTFARMFFGNGDPTGKKIKFNSFDRDPLLPHNAYFEIVGIVIDTKNSGLKNPPVPEAFLPYTLIPGGSGMIVRTAIDPGLLLRAILQQVWAVDSNVIPHKTETVENILQRHYYASPKFEMVTLGAFAGIGLLLVVIGVFSVMAYSVSLRTHEIGIRMALGAQQSDVLRMVLLEGLSLVASGVALGVLASLTLTRLIASQIWGVSPTDPLTFGVVIAVTFFVGLIACWLPARRATQVDPILTLRYE